MTAYHNLELFSQDRLPKKPYCTDSLDAGVSIRSFQHAVKKAYIQINPPHLAFWLPFDIDRTGGAIAWEGAGLPPPAFAVGNPVNGHAHLAYALHAPVLTSDASTRAAPIRYLTAIQHAYTVLLGADKGYSGLIIKNPLHERWRVLHGSKMLVDLNYLAEFVDNLSKYQYKRNAEQWGYGRNVSLFDNLRKWAYNAVRQYRGEPRGAFKAAVLAKANEYNGDYQQPLPANEVGHVAKSVANFCLRTDHDAYQRFIARQTERARAGGRASAIARATLSHNKRVSASIMAGMGYTQAQIALELGVTRMTIYNWLKSKV